MFSQRGEREAELNRCALDMVAAFEELLLFLAQPASAAAWFVPPLSPGFLRRGPWSCTGAGALVFWRRVHPPVC